LIILRLHRAETISFVCVANAGALFHNAGQDAPKITVKLPKVLMK
jgi:hypothetical protein